MPAFLVASSRLSPVAAYSSDNLSVSVLSSAHEARLRIVCRIVHSIAFCRPSDGSIED
jgi:acyl-coenzyme A thioesterase PaaI-like protein